MHPRTHICVLYSSKDAGSHELLDPVDPVLIVSLYFVELLDVVGDERLGWCW